jgi:hypothetical protein
MNRSVSRLLRMSATAVLVGGTTWLIGQAVAGLIVRVSVS